MPSRKSNVSVVSTTADDKPESTPAKPSKEKEPKHDGLSVEDISLPKSMIARLAKGVLPANTQIQKDALLALHKSATVFVSYIASNANENTQSAGKKTIAPHDVVAALKDAEFEAFIPRLQAELEKYSSTQNNKRNTYRKKVKEEKAAVPVTEGDEGDSGTAGERGDDAERPVNSLVGEENDDEERPFKKFKAKNGVAIDPEADDGDERDSEVEHDDDEDDDVDADGLVGSEEGSDSEAQESVDGDDETMGETIDELEAQAGIRDEGLDEPDSD